MSIICIKRENQIRSETALFDFVLKDFFDRKITRVLIFGYFLSRKSNEKQLINYSLFLFPFDPIATTILFNIDYNLTFKSTA